jgi:hypothetical protein
MCACGCFFVLLAIAGLAWCVIHGLWLLTALIVIVSIGAAAWAATKIRR